MVKKGLNVGDVFVDGDISYEVQKVNDDGTYISKEYVPDVQNDATVRKTGRVSTK